MITERKFSSSFTTLWRDILPLSDSFSQLISTHADRFGKPLLYERDPERYSYISELAYRIFSMLNTGEITRPMLSVENAAIIHAAKATCTYIAKLEGVKRVRRLADNELEASIQLAGRIRKYFGDYEKGNNYVTSPTFLGCGIVEACEGDVLCDKTLYEIKNVNRGFRILDMRQLLCYAALNYASEQYCIDNIGLLNARNGTFFKMNVENIAKRLSGQSKSELLSNIVDVITSQQQSL